MTPDEFNNLIHRLRTTELQKTAAEPDIMINVGVPGAWYFEWINANMGCPNRHIALAGLWRFWVSDSAAFACMKPAPISV